MKEYVDILVHLPYDVPLCDGFLKLMKLKRPCEPSERQMSNKLVISIQL